MKKSRHIFLRLNVIKAFIILFSLFCLFVGTASATVTVFGPKGYQRTTGQPNTFQETFTATEGEGQLELFNGGLSTGSQVTSAWVILNGKQILGPADFEKRDAVLQTPVMLEAQNTLQIKLASNPGTYVVARVIQDFPFEEDDSGVIKADLAVTDLVITPDRCAPQTPVSVQATVTNWGRQDSGPASLVFTVDGSETGRVPVSALPVGASVSFSVNLPGQQSGRHQVWASVEPGTGMIDPNPANNSRLATLRVSGESTPVPELEFSPPQFDPGPPAKITINVWNPSFADLSNIWLWLSVSGPSLGLETLQSSSADFLTSNQEIGGSVFDQNCGNADVCFQPDVTISLLAAGKSTEVQFAWPYETTGQYLVEVKAGNLPELFPVEELTASWNLVLPTIVATWTTPNLPLWSSMGPYLITDNPWQGPPNTGRIASLAVHPQYPNIIYAADASFGLQITGTGIWRSTDGGQSWKPFGDKFPQMNIMAIALDPADPNIVYCAGGVWRFDTPKPVAQGLPQPITGYIFKSIDGGEHWSPFGHPADGYSKLVVRRLAGNPQVVIYAASNRGVLRYTSNDPYALSSQDSEWPVILDGKISDVMVDPTDSNIVFAVRNISTGQYYFQLDGFYRTKTGLTATGNGNWSRSTLALTVPNSSLMFVDFFNANPQKIYLFSGSPAGGFDLLISNAQGDDFKVVYSLPPKCNGGRCATVNYIRAHPTIENLVYAGYDQPPFSGLLRMQNVNGVWYNTPVSGLHADQHAMEFFPDSNSSSGWGYVLGNDGGVYCGKYTLIFSSQAFQIDNVTPINNGLVSAEFYDAGFDVSPINPDVMIGGTQDNGVILFQPNSNPYGQWMYRGTGDGTAAVIAPSDPKTMYWKNESGQNSSIARSIDGGGIWTGTKHIGVVDGGGPIFTDPVSADTIYVGGAQVQQSIDGGDSWFQTGPSDPLKKGNIVQIVKTLISNPLLNIQLEILYAGTDKQGQLWVRYQAFPGWSWELVDEHPDPNAYIASMALAPTNSNILFVVYGNCTKDKRLRRFQFTYGSGWTGEWITGNMPEVHATTNTKVEINAIAVHPTDEGVVFVGTDKGVYEGMFSGNTWVWLPFNNGLPLVGISKLISVPLTGEIRAATSGRGVWRVNLTNECTICD